MPKDQAPAKGSGKLMPKDQAPAKGSGSCKRIRLLPKIRLMPKDQAHTEGSWFDYSKNNKQLPGDFY